MIQRNESSKPPIVVLTGAGISKESGLDTFRDEDGIWAKVNIDDVATPGGFRRNPTVVYEFYNMRRSGLNDPGVAPNAAHLALARLEQEWPGEVLIVTQNIDDLHERAGSTRLIHMHGELLKARCQSCEAIRVWTERLTAEDACPACGQSGQLRPHIVWFGEMPLAMDEIYEALGECGLFVSIGTSGSVYPAAGFVSHVRGRDTTHTVELNLEPSQGASRFTEKLYGPASELVPAFVERVLTRGW
ncbi:MAG: NAD-dependent protein deacylase [Alphaproteobacteria bacterium]|nr:NAD-dependent protein deacylase [Alphaproteobacteria bacterium]